MFVGSENITVELHYRKNKNGTVKVVRDVAEIPEIEKEKFQKVILQMKPLTWKKYNELQRSAMVTKGMTGSEDIDWLLYKEKKLLAVLVGWDSKDDKGQSVPVTPDNIYRIHPMIVEMALNEFDRMTLLGEEERKNS